jgi:2-iminobutanoate/2-iminopropanoate deaminase
MSKQVIVPPGVDPSKTPYSPGVRLGNLLFTSGMVGTRDGKLAGPDFEAQANQAMANLGAVLAAAGSSWEKVVKVTCFLVEPQRDLAAWNAVFKRYFPAEPPVRSTVGAGMVLAGALIEVEVVAEI